MLLFNGGEEELPEESEVVEEAFQGKMKRHKREREQDKRTRTASDELKWVCVCSY